MTGIGTGTGEKGASLSSTEQEQHIAYLKQAFCGFLKAKEAVEMEHLGEICVFTAHLIYLSSSQLPVHLILSLLYTALLSFSLSIGRVICAILGLSAEEQLGVMEGITRLTPVVVATSAAQSFATSITSLFA